LRSSRRTPAWDIRARRYFPVDFSSTQCIRGRSSTTRTCTHFAFSVCGTGRRRSRRFQRPSRLFCRTENGQSGTTSHGLSFYVISTGNACNAMVSAIYRDGPQSPKCRFSALSQCPILEGWNPSPSGETFRRFAVRKIDCARQYVRKPVEGGVVMPVQRARKVSPCRGGAWSFSRLQTDPNPPPSGGGGTPCSEATVAVQEDNGIRQVFRWRSGLPSTESNGGS